jgi:hypothetical protein
MIGHTTERLLIVRDPILAIHHLLPTPTHSQCGSLFGGSGSDAVPHTATKRHAPTGRLTATAPRYRAQPALHGSAATTALASRVGVVIVAVKATITIAPTKWAARAALQPFISTVDRDISAAIGSVSSSGTCSHCGSSDAYRHPAAHSCATINAAARDSTVVNANATRRQPSVRFTR